MNSVVIDFLPENAQRYGQGWTVVAVDVIRATTTAITAVALGRRCFPVPSIEAALPVAAVLDWPLLCGELGGNMPYGFDITNSPVAVASRNDLDRPLILLSSSGTQLVHNAQQATTTYIACLRNFTATIRQLVATGGRIAVIGAGTRGEFREEDQKCCALIAEGLLNAGFHALDEATTRVVDRWHNSAMDAWLESRSVQYLRNTNQTHDLEFVLEHIDDVAQVFPVVNGEVLSAEPRARMRALHLEPALAGSA